MMNIPALAWLLALPLVASPLIYLAGRLGDALTSQHGDMYHFSRWFALAVLAIAWVPLVFVARDFSATRLASLAVGSVTLRLDGLSLLVALLALTLGTLVVLFSGPDQAGRVGEEKYYAIVVAMVGTLIGLACAVDLFNLWVWFEALAVSSYLLVAFDRERPGALEASVKYLIQGASGSALALLGIALVLAQAGTLDLEQIRSGARASPLLLAAGGLFIAGFGVKAALVPLHTWLPDAYAEAPSGIGALLSGVVTKGALVILLRTLGALAGLTIAWGALLVGFGALNILAGNLLALRQTLVKRLLAYSSLSHMGYMFLGLGIGVDAGQVAGVQGGMFHLLTHGLMSGLAFLAAGALIYVLQGAPNRQRALTVADLAGASQRYPLAALALSVAVLGLGGLPPLAGFMSKWQIFVAGFETRNLLIVALVLFAALNSVLSLAYYAPLVNAVYRAEPSKAMQAGRPLPLAMGAPLAVLALMVLALGVWPGLAQWLTAAAGSAVLVSFGG
jgi:proton-translocating NADH-quinone oxidoreductase chain N